MSSDSSTFSSSWSLFGEMTEMENFQNDDKNQNNAVEPKVSMMDYGWNEDNIKLDFMTVKDMIKLIERSRGKFKAKIYSESATHIASKIEESTIAPFVVETSTEIPNASTTASPSPPLTLSVGAWQIREEDLPIYVGVAAGILCLIVILMTVTVWRCCITPVPARRIKEAKQNGSPRNNNIGHNNATVQGRCPDSFQNLDLRPDLRELKDSCQRPVLEKDGAKAEPDRVAKKSIAVSTSTSSGTTTTAAQDETRKLKVDLKAVAFEAATKVNQKKGQSHDSMVCLNGSRVESKIVAVTPSPVKDMNTMKKEIQQNKSNQLKQQHRADSENQDMGISSSAGMTDSTTSSADKSTETTNRHSDRSLDSGTSTFDHLSSAASMINNMSNSSYVKVPPVDSFLASTTFHTFHPPNGRNNNGGSPPQKLSPTSVADVESQHRHDDSFLLLLTEDEKIRHFRSLPNRNNRSNNNNNNNDINGKSRSGRGTTEQLNGNFKEDLYAKVDYKSKMRNRNPDSAGANCQANINSDMVAVVCPMQPADKSQIYQELPNGHTLVTFANEKYTYPSHHQQQRKNEEINFDLQNLYQQNASTSL